MIDFDLNYEIPKHEKKSAVENSSRECLARFGGLPRWVSPARNRATMAERR